MKNLHYAEIWAPVPEYEGLYEVSDLGRVRRKKSGRYLRYFSGRERRPRVDLSKNCARQKFYVYDLVLTSFVGPRPEGCFALHWNDDPWDNRLSNLRWGTRSMNAKDHERNKNRRPSYEELVRPDRSVRYRPKQLLEAYWRAKYELQGQGSYFDLVDISTMTGVDTATIHHLTNATSIIPIDEEEVERWCEERLGSVPF